MTCILLIAVVLVLLGITEGFVRVGNIVTPLQGHSSTAIFAHHVNKKITKRMMDRRPKKSRPSDINRNNVNMNKCITKVKDAPPEYTIINAEEYMKVRLEALKFWEKGDPEAEWLEFTPEDMVITLPQNTDPLPAGVQKKPPLVRSGSC